MALSHAIASQSDVFQPLVSCLSCLDTSFDRERVWGCRQAFASVFMLKSPCEQLCYNTAIPKVHRLAGASFGWKRTPDAAGLSRARRRLSAADERLVWQAVRDWSRGHAPAAGTLMPGWVVAAIDGTTLHVPRSRSLSRAFGMRDQLGLDISHYPQAQLVSAWDLDRRIPLAWSLTSKKVGERASALRLLDQLPARSILVMDRGFPGRELLGRILASGRHAIVRMIAAEGGCWPEVAAFLASGERSAVVTIRVRQGRYLVPVQVRLVRRVFKQGRPHTGEQRSAMVVLSTLVDPQLDDERILAIYHGRWGIETIHREMKSIAQVERWHGTTKRLIEQEVTALMCWFAIAGAIATRAEADAAAEDQACADQRQPRRVNSKRVFEAVAAILDWQFACLTQQDQVRDYLRQHALDAWSRMMRFMQRRRPGRWLPRVPKHPYARRVA